MADVSEMAYCSTDEPRKIPKMLFKYQPATLQAILNLSSSKIWFADPLTFNDPFDCAVDGVLEHIKMVLRTMDAPLALEIAIALGLRTEALTSFSNLTEEKIIQCASQGLELAIADRLQKRRGVCCFTEYFDNPLMWGHYADSHRGFCLGFDTTFLPFNDPSKCRPVKYRASMPKFELRELAKGNLLHVTESFLTKSECWDYESEWRLLHNEKGLEFGYDRHVLTDIYLGARMPDAMVEMISAILSRTDTKLHLMKLDSASLRVIPQQFTFTPIDYRASASSAIESPPIDQR